MVIWECETRTEEVLMKKLIDKFDLDLPDENSASVK